MRIRNGFTLLELLVVVAIVALLVGLTVVSMRTARVSASRSESLSALRQIAMGYTQYTIDNRAWLMPGYVDLTLFDPGEPFEALVVRRPSGTELAPADSQSYVWRLAPYVDHAWRTFFVDTTDTSAMVRFAGDFDRNIFGPADPTAALGGISERPSFGMNSIYVGGDSSHGDEFGEAHPWQDVIPKKAAVRLTEVKHPARLIVFGAAARATGSDEPPVYEDPAIGFCELRAPYLCYNAPSDMWTMPQWRVEATGGVVKAEEFKGDNGAGLPIDRHGRDRLPIAHLDGSTVLEQISLLARDMRRWNAFEVELRGTWVP